MYIFKQFFLLVLLCLLVSTNLRAQPHRGLLNEISKEIKAVNSKNEIFYLGIDNEVRIPSVFEGKSNLLVSTNNGIIFKDSINYNIIPQKLPNATVLISEVKGSDTTLLASKRFRVKYVPQPCITIKGICLNEIQSIDRFKLLSIDTLGVMINEDILGAENWVKIKRFSIGFVHGSVYRSYNTNGNSFSDEMKEVIRTITPGEELNIKVTIVSEGQVIRDVPVYKIIIF